LRGQTEQGDTPVDEDDPRGHTGLQEGVAVAVVSVEVPGGQGVHARAAEEEEYQPLGQGAQGSKPTAEYLPGWQEGLGMHWLKYTADAAAVL